MEKIDWKKKLTSRKFWAVVSNFIAQLMVAFRFSDNEVAQTVALIMAGAGVIAYIIGEGLVDAANVEPIIITECDGTSCEDTEEEQD